MTNLLDSLVNPQSIQYDDSRLVRLRHFGKAFGLLDWHMPVITVTGTNGKGSTVAALNRIYRTAGYRVGVFTSPHLLSVHERIQVNDEPISEESCNQLTQQLKSHPDFSTLSWFEAFLMLALLYFKQQNLDVVILEVGMGGRLDATNMIDADLVIVSNVDLDHQTYLGDTREEIAFQKAGLFRFQKPAIFADENCPQRLEAHAKSLHAPLYLKSKDFDYKIEQEGWTLILGEHHFRFHHLPTIHLAAMSSAIFASECLKQKLPVTQVDWEKAISTVFLPGRFQQIQQAGRPLLILDVGHNPHAAQNLVNRLNKLPLTGKIHFIFSILKDKDRKNVVDILKKMDILWYPCLLNCERACDQEALMECFENQTLYATPALALQKAREHAKLNDVIVAFGSFHLIEPLMRTLIEEGVDVFRNH